MQFNINSENATLDILRLLVDHGADGVNAIDKNGNTPLSLAAKNGHVRVIRYLLSRGADVNAYNGVALFESIKTQNLNLANCLLENNAKIDLKNGEGYGVLHQTINWTKNNERARYDFLNLFLRFGANVNDCDGDGTSVLHFAVKIIKDVKLVNFLHEQRASVSTKDKAGVTPLTSAIKLRLPDVVKSLIGMGALDYQRTIAKDGQMLSGPIAADDNEMLKLLLDSGVKADYENLHVAMFHKRSDSFKLLFSNYDCNNSANHVKHYLLGRMTYYSGSFGSNIMEYLLDLGADINYMQDKSTTSVSMLGRFQKYSTHQEAITIILKQIAFLRAQHFHVDEQNEPLIRQKKWMLDYYSKCQEELERMKETKVCSDNLATYFDVLTKRNNALVKCICRETVRAELNCENYKQFFKIFEDRIEKNYARGLRRLINMNKFKAILDDIFKDFLPDYVIHMISEYYNDSDFVACVKE